MKSALLFLLLFVGTTTFTIGQEINLSTAAIPKELHKNANAVVRHNEVKVEIEAIDKLTITTKKIITVLNEYGDRHVAAGQYYNKEIKIKNQQAIVYDALGSQVKKIKQKEFRDVSAVSSNDLYSESRVQYLDYTPQKYPYTIVYESEVQSKTTVFIAPWEPVSSYLLSVENSSYHFINPKSIPYRIQEKNMDPFKVEKFENPDGFIYKVTNVPAYKKEYLSPDLENFTPYLAIALDEFSLVGVKGKASNWQEFGKWQYDNLLAGKGELPVETIQKINSLTAGAKDDLEKARIIYQYVQDNTRYISVQLGIGGWEPMLAGDVDKLGYGDCKALTNYTKSLLDSQGITSHYAVVFGSTERKDIKEDFASMQGNHVILNIPQEDEDIWLECTSQTDPFNYLGQFTDNRNVLLIKPEGGEIVRTKKYNVEDNVIETNGRIVLNDAGGYNAEVKRLSKGVPYGKIYLLTREKKDKQVLYYKNHWSHLQNLNIDNIDLQNNRHEQEFVEAVTFNGDKLGSKAGTRLILPVNFFITPTYNVPRSEERSTPFEIARGSTYRDSFDFLLPAGFEIESLPENVNIENQFGRFYVTIQQKEKDGNSLIEVRREYVINDGSWEADSYVDFRDFMNQIKTANSQKAVIVANH